MQDQKNIGLHWFDPFGSTKIEDLTNRPAIPCGHRIVFWDQEPLYRGAASEFFDQFCAIYRPDMPEPWRSSITLVTSEINSEDCDWIKDTYALDRVEHYFFHGWAALDWYRGYNHTYLNRAWLLRDFRYDWICPNNIISGHRRHRVDLFRALADRGLIGHGLMSFPLVCPYSGRSADDLFAEIDWQRPPDLRLPLVIDQTRDHATHSHRIEFWLDAMQSFCHIVTETVYESSRVHLTEKTFKPVVLQQPFLLVAPRHSLRYLQSYGFQTFSDVWDESYDDLPDSDRVTAVAEICRDISTWSVQRRHQAQLAAWPAIQHNFKWFYGGFQDRLWQELTDLISKWQ